MRRVVVAGLALLLAAECGHSAAAGLQASARGCGTARALIDAGQQVPGGCKVEALDSGAPVALSEFAQGKPMVVNFWASWCGACIQEMPDLQRVYTSANTQVQFLGLDLLDVSGEDRAGALAFARQRQVSYPLAYDQDGLLYGRISLRVLPPTTAFLKADGTLAGFHIGQMSAPELRQAIQQYLGVQVAA